MRCSRTLFLPERAHDLQRLQITSSFFDTTLRDGEQSPGCSMTTQEKLTMAHALEDLGVDIIEAGFAMASEGDFAAIATITQAIRKPRIASLARAKSDDIEMAARAVQFADRNRIHVFLAASDLHLEYKLKLSRQEALDRTGESVRLARTFVDDVEFSPEDSTRADRDFLVEMVRIAIEAGATTINMPDTVGYIHARGIRADVLAKSASAYRPSTRRASFSPRIATTISASPPPTRWPPSPPAPARSSAPSTASASAPATPRLEEVAAALYVRGDRYGVSTSIKLDQLYATSQVLGQIITFKPSPNKAIVGDNAFAHESGIHQHGMLANPLCYEIMTPALVGVAHTHLVLGKHSGRAALRHRLEQLGFTVSREELQQTYYRFVALADRKKNIYDQDLIGILPDQIRERRGEPVSELD